MFLKRIQAFLLLLLAIYSQIKADSPIQVNSLPVEFIFDGMVDVGEWDKVQPIELTVQTPVHRGLPTEKTLIRIANDENYIYISGALYDSEPDKIGANTMLRDGGDESTDWFGLLIDSYNDKQNGLGFFTTPTASRFDAAIGNDARGREPMNISWNNFWDVKTKVTDEGWFAEMRIPFSSLQFQAVDGKVTMGITVWRYIARKNETHISPDISPELGEMGVWRPSQAKEYVFENVRQAKPFYITPYALAGYSALKDLNTSGTAYENSEDVVKDLGLDVKLGLSNNFTLDLTVNTDFAQVEADDQQINLSRFSLFFPEKRLFFQERSGIFSFRFGSRNNLFYSRRIGIDNNNNAIPIIGGARLTGRAGDWDIGMISMQTQKTDDFLSNNYSVFRVKKRILNDFSDAGLLMTYNVDADGTYNAVYGFDTNIRVWGDDIMSIKLAHNFNTGSNFEFFDKDQSLFWFSLSKQNRQGFHYAVSISRLGEEFNSNIGFIERLNYTRFGKRLGYTWWPKFNSPLLSHGINARGSDHWDNNDKKLNSSFNGIGWEFVWKNGQRLELGTQLQYENITEDFELAGVVTIPIRDYFFSGINMEYRTRTGLPFLIGMEAEFGDFYDGKRTAFGLSPVYNVSSNLSLTGTYQYNKINFPVREQGFDTHLARIKAQLTFSTKLSISSFIQYNSLNKKYFGNIRMRYNPREGNDLFIVYNTDVNAQRGFENPRLPLSNQQSLLVKYSYTFRI